MEPDFVLDGAGHGSVAARLLQHNGDVNCLRPYIGQDGRSYTSRHNGKYDDKGRPVMNAVVSNAPATLRKDEWIKLDEVVLKAAKQRLRAFRDLVSAGLTYSLPNAMGTMTLESQNQSDITPATVSMDGLRKSDNDRVEYDLVGLPLPIIHKDFSISLRQLMASRNKNTPFDTTMAELSAVRVAEEVEKLTLGVSSAYAYGGYSIYGYTNYPSRITRTLTHPLAGGWTPAATLAQIILMKQDSIDALHYGPWKLYNSPMWDRYLDGDYSSAYPGVTLRERILKIANIQSLETLDYLTGNDMILVQQSQDVVRAVIGMNVTTVQWESKGGMELNWKVMCILVPQLRADHYGKTGIVHGSAVTP